MATIPSVYNSGSGRSTPRPTRGGVVSFNSGAGEGLVQAGKQMQQFGAEVDAEAKQREAARNKLDSANIMLQAMQHDMQFEDDFRNNPSTYKTAAQDYQKKRSELNASLLAGVSNPEQKALVSSALQEQQLRTERSIKGLARSFETDATRSYLTDSYASAKQSIRNIDDMQRLLTVRKAQYDGYAASGVIPADDAARMFQAERRDAQSTVLNSRIASGDYRGVWEDLKAAPLNVRNNNPGNIRGADGKFREFATPEEGMAEMERDLGVKISGKSSAMKANFGAGYVPSIRNIISTWAPKSENDTNSYVASVAKDSGIDPDAPLSKDDIKKIMPAMIKVEGGSNSMSYYTQIDPDIRDTALRQLKPIIQSDVRRNWENTVVAAENGLKVGRVPESDLMMLDDPNAVANYNNAMDVAEKSYAFMGMPQQDIMRTVGESRPTDATAPNYASKVKQYEVLQQAAAKAIKAQVETPIETAMKVDPAIRELADKAAVDPKLYPAYFAALDDKYKSWGVTPKYRYITKPQSDAIAADIEGAMLKGGDIAAAKLKSYYDMWGGEKFGAIIGEMAPALSGPARVAASIYDNNNPQASRELLNLAAVKTEDLSAQVPLVDAEKIRNNITSSLVPFQQTLLNTNPGSGAQTFSDFREQAIRLAYSYAAKGMSASQAADLAARNIALDKYVFAKDYRVPIKYGDRTNDIERGARFVLNSMKPSDLAVPPGRSAAPEEYANSVRTYGKWVNTPEEDGLILMDDYNTAVLDKNGNKIKKTFEMLESYGLGVTKQAKELQDIAPPYPMVGP